MKQNMKICNYDKRQSACLTYCQKSLIELTMFLLNSLNFLLQLLLVKASGKEFHGFSHLHVGTKSVPKDTVHIQMYSYRQKAFVSFSLRSLHLLTTKRQLKQLARRWTNTNIYLHNDRLRLLRGKTNY